MCKGKELFCRVTVNQLSNNKVEFESEKITGETLQDYIEQDKRYGIFRPRNGKYFTVRIIDEDEEFSKEQVKRVIKYIAIRMSLYIPFRVRVARPGEYADFKIDFETVDSDPRKILTANTLMYHYFPIADFDNPRRGLCVVNKGFLWTSNGKPIPVKDMFPDHPNPNATLKTYDFDEIGWHEWGHGLGLPHADEPGHMMSPNAGIMASMPSELDIGRLQAKYGKVNRTQREIARWLRWLRIANKREII